MDYSEEFYAHHAKRYAEISHQMLQSIYIKSSHAKLTDDLVLIEHLKRLTPGKRGLDAGCGAGARDVYSLWSAGYDIFGIDSVEENIAVAKDIHPQIANRLSVVDLRTELPFPDDSFDFVMCNAVIQHIDPETVKNITLPALCRTLKRNGVLQLMFKNGSGVLTVFDKDYPAERSFQLHDEHNILKILEKLNMTLIESEDRDQLGGLMFFADPKHVDHCVFYTRKILQERVANKGKHAGL